MSILHPIPQFCQHLIQKNLYRLNTKQTVKLNSFEYHHLNKSLQFKGIDKLKGQPYTAMRGRGVSYISKLNNIIYLLS